MNEFLKFETMITPVLIQIIFWIGVVAVVIMGILTLFQGGFFTLIGLLFIFFGPIVVRVYAELLIVAFRINDHLRNIQNNTQR